MFGRRQRKRASRGVSNRSLFAAVSKTPVNMHPAKVPLRGHSFFGMEAFILGLPLLYGGESEEVSALLPFFGGGFPY